MIPPSFMMPESLFSRLAACSTSELAVLWRAFEFLLGGIERGRGKYGTTPGDDSRDYVVEAMEEIRDGLLYVAMHEIAKNATLGLSSTPKMSTRAAAPPSSDAAQPSASETATFNPRDFACKVCASEPDAAGDIVHGRGCYQVNADGGGVSSIDIPEHDACDCEACLAKKAGSR